MRLVFCGTPSFAVPTLHALLGAGHSVELVMTQPDRASGRGLVQQHSAVKQAALERNLPITQPEKIRNNPALQKQLTEIAADAIVVVAYGRLIPPWMLALPRHGNLNLHASLLPRYRGAAPIQWAIARGEQETGVTTMRIDEGLDTGAMLLQRSVSIGPEQTAVELAPILAEVGAALMVETLAGLARGTLTATPQQDALATLAPILQRE
ncbi:MAG TPA: methionyl-tRNA formyltransferase, partial [Acidobacteriaceae bacterium]|nr:methionyl-tRNA formyltransferase [Acidobacteriaceae bacterium]